MYHTYNLVLILTRHTLARAGLANRLYGGMYVCMGQTKAPGPAGAADPTLLHEDDLL